MSSATNGAGERTGYFLETQREPRVRRSRDAFRLGLGLLILAVVASDAVRGGPFQAALTDVADSLPEWVRFASWWVYALAGVVALAIVAGVLLRAPKNPGAARDVLLSITVAAAVTFAGMRLLNGEWPTMLPEFSSDSPVPQHFVLRIALVAAAVFAVAPHVARPVRRFGTVVVLFAGVAGYGLGFGLASDAVASIVIGLIAAAAVALVFGSPQGLPRVSLVIGALEELGLAVADLEPFPDQSWGVRRLRGHLVDGSPIEVKAYGRDAADTQLAAKAWRAIWYRDTGPDVAYTRMQAVEHEALMAIFADRAGVSVVEPLVAGRAGDEVAILALRRPGRPIAELEPGEITDATLTAIWGDLATMHGAGIAHGSPTVGGVLVGDDGHWFDDLASASLAAGDRVHADVATLLLSMSHHVGVERAVTSAREGLGADRLAAALPYLQLPALPRSLRRSLSKPKAAMAVLREAVADATGAEVAEPIKLRRVSVGSLVMALLALLAANVLIGQLAAIDYAAVWEIVSEGSFVALLVALVVAHLAFVPEAMSMMAAVGVSLPLAPLTILQISARFIALAVPTAAGRVAMNAAFLVKFGVARMVAVSQGAIDGAAGFVVEVTILLVAFAVSEESFALGGDVDLQAVLVVVAVVAAGAVALAFLVPGLRKRLAPILREAVGSVSGVFRDPRRIGMLLLGNLLSRAAFGLTLWIVLRAIGVGGIGIGVAVTVTVATNLLAGVVPIPGGIGVAEAVLTSWLVLVGVEESAAFAATVVYRMCTYYLPAVEGFFAMRWLEARDYL